VKSNKIQFGRLIENNGVVLINPAIDASDKEIHLKNNFSTTSKNIEQFL